MNWLFLITILLSGSANAAGVRCSSNCILIEPYQNGLVLLGKVSNQADLPQDQLFDLINAECANRAQKLGWNGQPNLVRQLWYQESKAFKSSSSVTFRRFARIYSSQQEYRRDVNVWLDFDQADSACKPDSSIPGGTAPLYPGAFPFHG